MLASDLIQISVYKDSPIFNTKDAKVNTIRTVFFDPSVEDFVSIKSAKSLNLPTQKYIPNTVYEPTWAPPTNL